MKNWILFICIFFCSYKVVANEPRINILKQIASLQSKDAKDFPDGAFPSFRRYHFSKTLKADYNLFYTALVIYNIERYKAILTQEELSILAQIKANANPYFELFKNKKNNLTYNFWPKYPAQVFPNGGWLNKFNEMNALPDDVDDCSLLMLALGNQDSLVNNMSKLFLSFTNTKVKKSNGYYKRYKNSPVYNTWLGNGYPIDIDISVLSNVLLLKYTYHQSLNKYDSASLDLIVDVLKRNKHINDPSYASVHYSNASTIIYHVARLMQYSNHSSLLQLKPLLLKQSYKLLDGSKSALERLILINSIMQMGGKVDENIAIKIINDKQLLIQNDYPYFNANMAAILNNPFKRILSATKIGKFYYYSDAFNLSLLFEQEMLRQKLVSSN